MRLEAKIERLEQAAGVAAGACALCASRAAKAEAEGWREFGPEWERGEAYPSTHYCPQCERPFEIVFQVIQRRGAAEEGAAEYEH